MKNYRILLLAAMSLLAGFRGYSQTPVVGQKAPDFTLPYATQDTINFKGVSLSSLIGKSNIVLAFYPADWSSGCTKEMCTFRDDFSKLASLHADILALSGDYVFADHEWARQLHLPITLVSDHMHNVAKIYNSFNEKTGFNKRTVVLIDRMGNIAYEDMDYSVASPDSFLKLQAALKKLD